MIWTKGGCWDRRSPFTKLLVLKEHLPERPRWQRYQHKLSSYQVRLIERELMHHIDPDRLTVPEAKIEAVSYVRRRIPEWLGYRRDVMSAAVAAWFFQTTIPVGRDRYVGPRPARGRRGPVVYVDRTQRRQRSWA